MALQTAGFDLDLIGFTAEDLSRLRVRVCMRAGAGVGATDGWWAGPSGLGQGSNGPSGRWQGPNGGIP
jgi:hypothetical protein